MDALRGEQRDFSVSLEMFRGSEESLKDGCDVLHGSSHQDPLTAGLCSLELVEVLAGDPDERSTAVVQPGGDKGVNKFFCS